MEGLVSRYISFFDEVYSEENLVEKLNNKKYGEVIEKTLVGALIYSEFSLNAYWRKYGKDEFYIKMYGEIENRINRLRGIGIDYYRKKELFKNMA